MKAESTCQPTDILIVDDRMENLLSLEALLESPELNIVRASSGNEALGLTLDHEFALILLDVQMPDMDGFETAELLRARKKTREIPIIFVTAISKDSSHVFRGYESGAVDYLFKPVDPHILKSKVRVFVDLHRRKSALLETTRRLERTVEELRQSEQRFRESEEKYRLLVENANDLIIIFRNDHIIFHNPRVEEMTGFSAEEIESLDFLQQIHPEDRDNVLELCMNPDTCTEPLCNGFRFFTKDGNQRWGMIEAVAIRWGGAPATLAFIRDITPQRELENQLLQSQKLEAIGTLAGGIAHDFNNLLGAILGFSEMSIQESHNPEIVRNNIRQVVKAGKRARELVRQILSFGRKNDLNLAPMELNPVIRETLKLLRATIPRTIDIRADITHDPLSVHSNPSQIHQVLMNLCTNAAHAIEDQQGVIEITLKRDTEIPYFHEAEEIPDGLISEDTWALLTVSDSGCGMDAEQIGRIFDPYFTTKEIGKGTGLGLSVVHGIVKSHRGFIRVRSAPNEGARFEIRLPLAVDETEMDPLPEDTVPAEKGSGRILFVDDEALLAELGVQMLEYLGYTIESFSDPTLVLRAFLNAPDAYDLLITDMTMPEMTGEMLADQILNVRPDLPVILCTGYSDRINEAKAGALGIQKLLLKPLDMNHLASAVREAISGGSE